MIGKYELAGLWPESGTVDGRSASPSLLELTFSPGLCLELFDPLQDFVFRQNALFVEEFHQGVYGQHVGVSHLFKGDGLALRFVHARHFSMWVGDY